MKQSWLALPVLFAPNVKTSDDEQGVTMECGEESFESEERRTTTTDWIDYEIWPGPDELLLPVMRNGDTLTITAGMITITTD